jgi:hypothetical protein
MLQYLWVLVSKPILLDIIDEVRVLKSFLILLKFFFSELSIPLVLESLKVIKTLENGIMLALEIGV